ncbi:MAG: response regulator [Bacteroidales bacterium]|nr:response regulator [Bacteroidales bacterium]
MTTGKQQEERNHEIRGELESRIRELESRVRELESRIREQTNELTQAKIESHNANQKKTMFLANMSHEIRTPMNSILGIYNLLKQTNLNEEQQEFLEIIHIASQNLLIIINDILDLSKIEAGELQLEKKPYSLHEEIQQVIKLLSLKARGKGIDLYSRIDAGIPVCLIGDAIRLKQIMINLANNAIKFTNEGEVQIAIETIDPKSPEFENQKEFIPEWINPDKLNPKQQILKFEVIDTGIGISDEDQETLFYEFAQLENPLVRRFEGSGLGLSISRNLTRLMKGKMGVVSQEGKGSVFWFTLLVEAGDEALLKKEQEEIAALPGKTRKLDVLLVEDNLLNQKFAMTTMTREGHRVDLAENGKIALDKFRNNHYDLILMDIAMPVMDGMEASRMIREIEQKKLKSMSKKEAEAFAPVKIVAITAHIMMTDKKQCLNVGMNDFLAKPYRPNDLLKIIEKLEIH